MSRTSPLLYSEIDTGSLINSKENMSYNPVQQTLIMKENVYQNRCVQPLFKWCTEPKSNTFHTNKYQ